MRTDPESREVLGSRRSALRDVAATVEDVYGLAVGPDSVWIHLPGNCAADQGWKLHISAILPDALTVLDSVLPLLKREGVSAKVAGSLDVLAELNEGWRGPSQIGKFVTVYPDCDEQAVALAEMLDRATAGLRGPAVPSDRCLRSGSIVHYRYGAFLDRSLRLRIGQIVSAVATPDGSTAQDHRDTVYRQPAWMTDPFRVESGSSEPARRPLIVAGRYVTAATLHRSARGAVYLAVDLQDNRRCVLKRAPAHSSARMDGQDAHDLLRHEFAMLERLRDCDAFPEPLLLVEDDGELYLAMEDIAGPSLSEAAAALPGGERARHVALWAAGLARALEQLHRRRIIHGDVKPANIVIDDAGEVRLLDLDLAYDLDGTRATSGTGSLGYRSPERTLLVPPEPLDDIWSLGATMLAALTGVQVPLVPDPSLLAELPEAAFPPGTSPALRAAITGCLSPPMSRWQSMASVAAAFDRVGSTTADTPHDVTTQPPASTRQLSLRNACTASLDMARVTTDGLLALGVRGDDSDLPPAMELADGVSWRSTMIATRHGISPDLNIGAAGPVLALADIVATTEEPAHAEALAAASASLRVAPRPPGYVAPGLWVGEAGRGAALLRAGQVLHDRALISAAADVGREVATLPHESPDFYNGSAGRLLFHLLLLDETGDDEHRVAALDAGRSIEGLARRDDGLTRWVFPDGFDLLSGDSRTLGYAHGAAGIADSLLDLADVDGDPSWLDLAGGAVRTLASEAVRVPNGLAWPRVDGGELIRPAWCHGAAGIGRFLLRAARVGIPDAERLALGAASATATAAHGGLAGQCHGLSGAIEFLLDAYQMNADPAYLEAARQLESTMAVYSFVSDGHLQWIGELPDRGSHEYAVGSSGIIPCLLRLAEPEGRPTQLSRAGFRWPAHR